MSDRHSDDSNDAGREPRYELSAEAATLRTPMGSPAKVVVRNLSKSGFQTEWPYLLKRDDRVWLKISGVESLPALVAWFDRYTIGCRFEHPLHDAVLADIVAKAGGKRND